MIEVCHPAEHMFFTVVDHRSRGRSTSQLDLNPSRANIRLTDGGDEGGSVQ